MTIQADKDSSVLLATTKTKKQNKPSALLHKSALKKEFSRMSKAVANQVFDSFVLFYFCFLIITTIYIFCFLLP